MTDLAVSALVRKRAELAGEIEALEGRLAELRASLTHLDATILLFDPGYELAGIRPKRPPGGETLFANGELTRLVYGALRGADEPLDTGAITARVMAAKGWTRATGDGRRTCASESGRRWARKPAACYGGCRSTAAAWGGA